MSWRSWELLHYASIVSSYLDRQDISHSDINMPTWYILLWLITMLVAIFSKSLIANLAMIFVSLLGFQLALQLNELDVVKWGVAGIFVLGIGLSATQMLTRVDKL